MGYGGRVGGAHSCDGLFDGYSMQPGCYTATACRQPQSCRSYTRWGCQERQAFFPCAFCFQGLGTIIRYHYIKTRKTLNPLAPETLNTSCACS